MTISSLLSTIVYHIMAVKFVASWTASITFNRCVYQPSEGCKYLQPVPQLGWFEANYKHLNNFSIKTGQV